MAAMKQIIAAIFIGLTALPVTAFAGQAEVRDVALSNNCPPKKVEIYKQQLGTDGEVVYRVQCNVPKTTGDNGGTPPNDTIMISCRQNLCAFVRSLPSGSK